MSDFYLAIVKTLRLADDDTVLVVCGGSADQRALERADVQHATISNLSPHDSVQTYGSYAWEYQDAENISHPDGSFDWVIVHAGLHHCASPHRALCEMFRVARKGVLVIESRDSFVVRAAVHFGLTADFETEPALLSNGKSGGQRNLSLPNFVYRWTEREINKTLSSFDPAHKNTFEYHYMWSLPTQRIAMSRNPVVRATVRIADAGKWFLATLLPRQANNFGIVVRKSDDLHPWVRKEGAELVADLDYISKRYDKTKYRKPSLVPTAVK